MLISGLVLILASATSSTGNADYCARLAKRFDANERLMGMTFDLNVRMYRAAKEAADASGRFVGQQDAFAARSRITKQALEGFATAREIESQMLAAKCQMPDHDATYATYAKEVMPD